MIFKIFLKIVQMDNIRSIIKTSMKKFIKDIATKYDDEVDDVRDLWECYEEDIEKVIKEEEKKLTKSTNEKIEKKVEPETKVKLESGCPYVFSKGQKQGQKCGVKSKNGQEFCSLHKKKDGPQSTTSKRSSTASNDTTVSKSGSIMLKKYNENLIHTETQLIFDRNSKSVIGKLVNDQVKPLTESDKETCNKFRFRVFTEPKKTEAKTEVKAKPDTKPETTRKSNESEVESVTESMVSNETNDTNDLNEIEIDKTNETVKKVLGF